MLEAVVVAAAAVGEENVELVGRQSVVEKGKMWEAGEQPREFRKLPWEQFGMEEDRRFDLYQQQLLLAVLAAESVLIDPWLIMISFLLCSNPVVKTQYDNL